MKTYELNTDDGYSELFEDADDDAAREEALSLMAQADFDLSKGTVWYHGRLDEIVTDDEGDEQREFVADLTCTFEPDEPDCDDEHDHDWQSPYQVLGGCKDNPGVWGHGGGVIIKEVCAHCGTYRRLDTWAQDPSTGEQGLHSVRYEPADDTSLEWVASLRDA